MYLRTFGGLTLEPGASHAALPSLGPRRLGLLAIVAAAGRRGIRREKVLGILWPEKEEEQARHTLSQTLYLLRRDAGSAWITGSTPLRLDPSIGSDVGEFQDALHSDQLERAAALYTGAFLEGFYLAGAPQFEEWVEETRARLQFAAVKALETLARRAVDAGAPADAAGWWRRLGEIDPFNATYAAGRVRALIAAGEPASALRCAREYESRLRRELDADPDPVITGLVAQLRALPEATTPARTLAPDRAAIPREPAIPVEPAPPAAVAGERIAAPRWRRYRSAAMAAGALIVAAAAWRVTAGGFGGAGPGLLAIGAIESRDTAALGPVLRDMLAANMARVPGLDVVANSRLLELLPPASDASPAATADAARRAGASDVVEGELDVTPAGLVLTLRRVDLRRGRVVQGYTVRAADLYVLTDSVTLAITRDFGLDPPPDAVATVRTSSAIAYALYEQGLRSHYQGDFPATSRLMSAALEHDSTFAMAAFFFWTANRAMGRFDEVSRTQPLLRRLAARAVDRERLWIETAIAEHEAPAVEFLRIARAMTDRFPDDPEGQTLLGTARAAVGDWGGAVAAFNRAIAIDSAAGAFRGPYCRVCSAIHRMWTTYVWWDSVPAAERTARRLVAFRPTEGTSWLAPIEPLLRQGRRAEAEALIARADQLSGFKWNYQSWFDRDLIRWGHSEELEARLVSELRYTPPDLRGERPWLLAFCLRNQGRLREAYRLAADGIVGDGAIRLEGHRDIITLAIVALDRGRPAESARLFLELVEADRTSGEAIGPRTRLRTWHMTLAATALAAAGDTAAVRALADSVERIGPGSSIGRDFRLHHFLRGLLFQRQNRHAEAVEAFRRSLYSLPEGYTRTNLELARSLMTLQRYPEAIAVLQPPLRGSVDGSNTYVTHTELHEAIAHAFHAAGQRDSAAAHYAAVERAWRRADLEFTTRYQIAKSRATSTRP